MFSTSDFALSLKILTYPNKSLNNHASQVFDFHNVPTISQALRITAIVNRAEFLSAPQCAIPFRIIFLRSLGYCLINPEVVPQEAKPNTIRIHTRCASFPNKDIYASGPDILILRGLSESGEEQTRSFAGKDAIHAHCAMQYLNGKTLAREFSKWQKFKMVITNGIY